MSMFHVVHLMLPDEQTNQCFMLLTLVFVCKTQVETKQRKALCELALFN